MGANELLKQLDEAHFFTTDLIETILPIYLEWGELNGSRYTAIINLLLGQSTAAELNSPAVQKSLAILKQKNERHLLLPEENKAVLQKVFKQIELNYPHTSDPLLVMSKMMNIFLLNSPLVPPRSAENKQLERMNNGIRILNYFKQRAAIDPFERQRNLQRALQARLRNVSERSKPIIEKIEQLLDENLDYRTVAERLNQEGIFTVDDHKFNEGNIKAIVSGYELVGRKQRLEEIRKPDIQNLLKLLDGFPYSTEEETAKAIESAKDSRTRLGRTISSRYINTHPNSSFLHAHIFWTMKLPPFVDEYFHILLASTSPQFNGGLTLVELVTILLQDHPENGIKRKKEIIAEASDELVSFFELFHHPYAKLLTNKTLTHFIFEGNLTKLLLPAAPRDQEYFTSSNGNRVELSKIQELFDQGLSYKETVEALRELGIEISIDTLKNLVGYTDLKYVKAENDLKKQKERNDNFFEKVREIQELRQKIVDTLPENRDEKFWSIFQEVLLKIRELKAQDELYSPITHKFGNVQAQIQDAIETSFYPENDLTILGSERFRNDYNVLLSIGTVELIETRLQFERVPILDKEHNIVACAVNIGELVVAVIKHLMKTDRTYKNYVEFYKTLTEELQEIFTLDVQPYVETISTQALAQSVANNFPELHKGIQQKLRIKR